MVLLTGGVAQGFGQVVVKGQMRGFDVRQVGGDVALGDVDLAVLHVFRVHELDVVDQPELVEQHRADQTIEITARHQTKLSCCHFCFPALFPWMMSRSGRLPPRSMLSATVPQSARA
ncbi:hypothetical protein D3C85_1342860 [compost metagenome]